MGLFSDIRQAEESSDVVDTIVGYAKQETLEPLKGAGRWVLVGSIASLFVSIGMVLVLLGALRLLVDLSGNAFDGGWSFVPYMVTFVLGALIVLVTLSRVKKRTL
jgi:hypothetical protein